MNISEIQDEFNEEQKKNKARGRIIIRLLKNIWIARNPLQLYEIINQDS